MSADIMEIHNNPQSSLTIDAGKPKLDDRFIMNIKGKDFVQYAGLLDLAHQYGLVKLEVEHLQFPTKENNQIAICRAVATSKNGAVFSDVADADPSNVNKMIAPHILRMASTRAKARALRDMCNIGITSLEELGSLDDVLEENGQTKPSSRSSSKSRKENGQRESSLKENVDSTHSSHTQVNTQPANPSNPSAKNDNPHSSESKTGVTPKLSEAQRRAIMNLSQRRGIKETELESMAMKAYGLPVSQLSPANASSFIRTLQQTG